MCGALHHIRARKHFARFLIAPPARELRIDDGIPDRGMPDPILHETQVRASVKYVGGNRVLEGVEMALALGDVRAFAIVLDQFIKTSAADRGVVAREEQGGRVALPLFQVGFDGFEFVGLQRVQSGEGMFEAVDAEPVLLHVEVCGLEHPDLGGSEAVAVGEQENGVVAF